MRNSIAAWTLGLTLAVSALSAHAADVTLTSWLYGNGALGSVVDVRGSFRGRVGGLNGSLSGAGDLDATPFVTYSVEYGSSLRMGSAISGYSLVRGADYFERRMGDAGIAEQIARLMGYADGHGALVNSAAGSASLQIAIWGAIQDHASAAALVAGAPAVTELLAGNAGAQTLLAGAQTMTDSRYDVWVLERDASADLLLLKARASLATDVPEPGSLALALTALAGLGLAARRRQSCSFNPTGTP